MIPAIPAGCCYHRCGGMPAAVADDGLPYAATAIVVVSIDEALIARWPAVLRRRQNVDRFCRSRAVQIPDIDLAVVGTRVNVAAVGRAGWREMASDQRLENAVVAESDKAAVVRVWLMVFGIVR